MPIYRIAMPFLCALFTISTARANIIQLPPANPCAGTPSMAQCTDPQSVYLTQCPAQQPNCDALLGSSVSSVAQSLPMTRTALVPDSMTRAGESETAHYANYNYASAGSQVSGVGSGYFGSSMNHAAYVLNPPQNGRIVWTFAARGWAVSHVDPQAAWLTDGTAVNSCEEYIYKRYSNYSRLQDLMAPLGDDWTTRAEYIYVEGLETQLNTTVIDESNNVVMKWGWPARYQNIYAAAFASRTWPLLTFTWDPQVANFNVLLHAGQYGGTTPTPVDPAAQFDLVLSQVDQFGEDLLEKRYEEMKNFQSLLKQRDEVYSDFSEYWNQYNCAILAPNSQTGQGFACNWKKMIATGEINNIDTQINQAMLAAFNTPNEDCFDPTGSLYGPSACTLSPHQIADEMDDAINAQREVDYDQCLRLTANNFGAGSLMSLGQQGALNSVNIPPSTWGYTHTSWALHDFLDLVQSAVKNVQLPIDPATGAVMLGDSKSDSGSFGSSLFGANYSYQAGWSVSDLHTSTPSTDPANANLHILGSLNVNAWLFGQGVPALIDYLSQVDSAQSSIAYQTHFNMLGQAIYPAVAANAPATFDISIGEVDKGGNIGPPLGMTVLVGPIPVSVSGGVSAGVGFYSTMSGSLTRDPVNKAINFGASGVINPYAHVDAWAKAGIGISGILEAGIGGDLTLVRVDLPLTMDAAITGTASQGMNFNGASNLDLKLSTFGGTLYVFLDSLFGSIQQTIVAWPGLTTSKNLFHLSFNLPLSIVMLTQPAPEAGQAP